MTGAYLAAVERILLPHLPPDKGMVGLALHRNAARRPDLCNGVPGQSGIVSNPCTGGLGGRGGGSGGVSEEDIGVHR